RFKKKNLRIGNICQNGISPVETFLQPDQIDFYIRGFENFNARILEIEVISILTSKGYITLVSCYRSSSRNNIIPDEWQIFLDSVKKLGDKFIIGGDLNAHHEAWGSKHNCQNGNISLNFTNSRSLIATLLIDFLNSQACNILFSKQFNSINESIKFSLLKKKTNSTKKTIRTINTTKVKKEFQLSSGMKNAKKHRVEFLEYKKIEAQTKVILKKEKKKYFKKFCESFNRNNKSSYVFNKIKHFNNKFSKTSSFEDNKVINFMNKCIEEICSPGSKLTNPVYQLPRSSGSRIDVDLEMLEKQVNNLSVELANKNLHPLSKNNIAIKPSSHIKVLGLILDKRFNWNLHIAHIVKKCDIPVSRIEYGDFLISPSTAIL
ncbi:hypothetical protein ALC53_01406, partial [Atta colombica]